MASCYHCGEEIEFIHNGFQVIPIHPSGSCSGRGGYGSGSGWRCAGLRTTNEGQVFEFPFLTYPSYVNPNARCPECGVAVFFYQSPYGGRVFFDDLGPPWPKHPCTDHPAVRREFSTAEGRARFLLSANKQTGTEGRQRHDADIRTTPLPAWAKAGWMPFVVKKIVRRACGIEAEGDLFESPHGEAVPFRIKQTLSDARFTRIQSGVSFGYSLVENSHQILSVLNEYPILLQKNPDLCILLLSSFILTQDRAVEEIRVVVSGEPSGPCAGSNCSLNS